MIEPALSTATPAPEEDVTTTLYRAAIGPVNNTYYLPIFTRFEAADHAGISWNSAASLMTLNWLVFRKLWVAALAYVGIVVAVALLVFGIGHLVFQFSDTLMMALGLGFGLAAFVLPGLFGNALFHTECRKAMSQALVGNANIADARAQLLRQAASPKRLIGVAMANAVFWILVFFAYQQFSGLGNVAVLPHGALDSGQVAVGRADSADAVRPATAASTTALTSAASPVPLASATASASPAASEASPIAAAPASSMVVAMASAATSSVPAAAAASTADAGRVAAASAPQPAQQPAVATPTASAPAVAPAVTATPPVAPSTASAPAAPAAKAATQPQAKPASAAKTDSAASVPAVQVRAHKDAEKAKHAAKKPQATAAADPAAKAFYVNVGLFGVPENAAKAHAKLLEAGLPSVMKELKAKTRQIRVRVGPFATQSQADAAVEKIKALQLDAVVVQL